MRNHTPAGLRFGGDFQRKVKPMLPFEKEHTDKIHEYFTEKLDDVQALLDLSIELTELFAEKVNRRGATVGEKVVSFVFHSIIQRFRSIILLCERGFIEDAEVLTRSFFELLFALRFILRPPNPNPEWSTGLRREFDELCDLGSDSTLSKWVDMDFRAHLYSGSDLLKLDKLKDQIEKDDKIRPHFPAGFADKNTMHVKEVEAVIGPEWARRIKKTNSYSGFSRIELLAEYCDLRDYSKTLWKIHSHKSHGQGAVSVRRDIRPKDLVGAINIASVAFGMAATDMNDHFDLGKSKDLKLIAVRFDPKKQKWKGKPWQASANNLTAGE